MLYSWNNASSIFHPQHISSLDLTRMANCKRTSVALAAWCWIECLPNWDRELCVCERERAVRFVRFQLLNDELGRDNSLPFLYSPIFIHWYFPGITANMLFFSVEMAHARNAIGIPHTHMKYHITHLAWNEWCCSVLDHPHSHQSWNRRPWDL